MQLSHSKIWAWASLALLVGVYLDISLNILSRDRAWISAETVAAEGYILSDGIRLHRRDLLRALNTDVFEHGPRVSRPLSSLFEIVDTKFRAWSWRFMEPHASFSLTLIFSLGLTPLLLFLLLRQLGVPTVLARLVVCLYLASPGCLSCVALLFRPSKAMTNFSLALCLYLASFLEGERLDFRYIGFLLLMFFSFFWDETALLLYPAVVVLFPRVIGGRARIYAYLTLPAFTALFYFVLLPWLEFRAGFGLPKFEQFSVLSNPQFHGTRAFLSNLLANTRLFFTGSLGIGDPIRLRGWGKWLILADFGALLGLVAASWNGQTSRQAPDSTWRLFVFLLLLCVFHTLLMAMASPQCSPIFWYGCYWSLLFAVLVALTGQLFISTERFQFALVLVILSSLYLFPFMSDTARDYFYRDSLAAKIERQTRIKSSLQWFDTAPRESRGFAAITHDYWEDVLHRRRRPTKTLPRELAYLSVELAPYEN